MIYYTNLDPNEGNVMRMNVSACESILSLLDDLGFDLEAGGFAAGHDLFDPAGQPGEVSASTAHAWGQALEAALDEDLIVEVIHSGEWGIVEGGTLRLVGPQVRRPLPNGSVVQGLDVEALDWLHELIDFLEDCEGFQWQ